MATLVWDRPGKRIFETGIDRGVLYINDDTVDSPDFVAYNKAVPWNGLLSYTKTQGHEGTAVYYDGAMIHHHHQPQDYSGSLSAIHYPDEFDDLQGSESIGCGATISGQGASRFGLCYRTQVLSDSGRERYKLHIVYDLIASPDAMTYNSTTNSPAVMAFNWTTTTVPLDVEGFRPTSEIVLDSRKMDPLLMEIIENRLYGEPGADGFLPTMELLMLMVDEWFRLRVTVDGDQWTVEENIDGSHISVDEETGMYTITSQSAIQLGPNSHLIQDLLCVGPESVAIDVTEFGNDKWIAMSPYDGYIAVDNETGFFTIHNANAEPYGPNGYVLHETMTEN